jgi:hypothetical protein
MKENFSIENEGLVLAKAWPQHQKLELRLGNWSAIFNEQEIKVIIAVALNYCAEHEGLKIIGYLITGEKVSLIVAVNEEEWNEVKIVYDRKVTEGISEMLNQNKCCDDEVNTKPDVQFNKLFKECPLTNQYLIQLITGRKIALAYYNVEVEKLKEQVDRYDFCSAIDYAGAKGPVLVVTKW